MKQIIPHLWFDKEAKEAAEFYTSLFPDSKVINTAEVKNTPSSDTDVVTFEIWGQKFMAISAGPLFKFNPSVSFMVNFDPLNFGPASTRDKEAREKLDQVWNKLMEGGTALMALDKYPFSERYGWVQDKYGLSWQLILTNPEGEPRPPIVPSLLFVGSKYGKAEEAVNFYVTVFKNSKIGNLFRYGPGRLPDKEGTIMYGDVKLEETWFAVMDSAHQHMFDFNEAVSFVVQCADQAEIDYYWNKLSAVPESEQCGWLKDKFGLSWQITPAIMEKMLYESTPEQMDRVTHAFLKMKKFDVATLQRAYEGK
ncbi:MAG: VOC family protein [Chitinophagaceae bacterium]|nr:VOC family protein [Chitinophagaceae bacterium]